MKESEREAFRLFCALSEMDPGEFKEKDPPDFVRQSGDIAIELVEYHQDPGPKGSKLREREETIFRRVAEGKARFQALSPTVRMDVFVWFRPGQIPTPEAMFKLAEYVAANAGKSLKLGADSMPEGLTDSFDSVDIFPTWELQEEILWQAPEAANVDPSLDAVQALLQQKNEKIAAYRTAAKEIWLLIHSGTWPMVGDPDGSRPSTCAQIDAALLERIFRSNFDRVYFLDQGRRQVERLRIIQGV